MSEASQVDPNSQDERSEVLDTQNSPPEESVSARLEKLKEPLEVPLHLEDLNEKVKSVSEEYLKWVEKNIEALEYLSTLARKDPEHSGTYLTIMSQKASEIGLLGAGFHYPLMAVAADSLRYFVSEVGRYDKKSAEIIDAHIKAMRVIRDKNIQDHGGLLGRKILFRLETAVNSSIKKVKW
ncbi:hypothetical protein [Emcibacter nanhaiensis]|uniref:Uncharacterized protein n=1 Tax=Emcibacter nanhaiensis TaxID=1505037 RepID=A0A501PH37_9PROT|nr:hypothetical protein [Emcibacter nanhaiensis]TPD59352.1 hypothetical protein FIV46_11195 [Emcibacter nanhaiensis]